MGEKMLTKPFLAAIALLLAMAPHATFAGVKEGVEKWQAGDYKAAVIEWLPQAAKGDPDALFNMGQAYKLGRGVAEDKDKAEDFYRRASDKGHAPAQTNLGIVLAQRGQKTEAANLWQQAAKKNDARAQYMLGVLHFNGDTLPKNWPLAYAYILQANNAGLAQAARALATMDANMPKADRDRGAQIADSFISGDRLANSGAILSPPRKIDNTVAVNKPAAAQSPESEQSSVTAISTPQASASQSRRVVTTTATPKAQPSSKASSDGRWRVQLGAYSQEARARAAWAGLQKQQESLVSGTTPFFVHGGGVVRLQIGSFPVSSDADALCRALKASGSACFTIAAN